MAVVAEELISDLIVRDGKLRSGIRSAQQAYGAGIGSMRNDTKRFESEFNRSSSNVSDGFKRMAGTLAAGVSLAATTNLIDNYTRLQNALRVAGLEGSKLAEVQNSLLALSSRYGVSINELANLYGKSAQAASDLGAGQEQLLQITEASAQALKITGTSATQAQGALLGLTQALSSGIVRAEEFNQINEGGLRPLLQVAAGAERFGGSVAKLRAAVVDGKFSSQEFYKAILEGSEQLENQASKATLTLAGAFEALTSSLTVYVGGAASANGITGALSAGIGRLAENLDTIIPALAVIVGLIGLRYVASLTAAIGASLGLRAASLSLAVSLNGVGAAAGLAGRGLLAAFGGPVGAAVIGLTAVLAGLSYAVRDTGASLDTLQGSVNEAQARLEDARKQAAAAGVDIKRMGDNADGATGSFSALNSVLWKSVDAMTAAANSAKNLALARIMVQNAEAQGTLAALGPRIRGTDAAARRNRAGNALLGQDVSGYQDMTAGQKAAIQEDRARYTLAKEILKANKESAELIKNTPNYVAPASAAAASAVADEKKKKEAKGRKGPDLAEQAAQRAYREEQELRSLRLEEIRAKEQIAATVGEQANLQRDALDLERQSRVAEVEEGVRRKELNADQAKAQLEIIEALYGAAAEYDEQGMLIVNGRSSLYGIAIAQDEARKAEEERASLSQTQTDLKREELQFAYDMADTQAERRELALQMIALDEREQRAKLEGIIATEQIGSLRRREAEALLAALDGQTSRARDRATRDSESPLERYRRESTKTAEQIKEDIENIQVQGLEALGDGITDVIMQTRSLGDVFKSVANQIISDLIRIAVQKAIIGPLTDSLFGGGGGGGLASLFGGGGGNPLGSGGGMDLRGFRAGGGPVRAGQLYRVNEGQQEFFRPATDGRMVPLSQAQAARPAARAGAGPTIIQLSVAPGELFVPMVEGISGDVAIRTVQTAAPSIVRAATNQTMRQAGRPRT